MIWQVFGKCLFVYAESEQKEGGIWVNEAHNPLEAHGWYQCSVFFPDGTELKSKEFPVFFQGIL